MSSSLAVSTSAWAVMIGLVIVMLAIDFVAFARGGRVPSLRASAIWSVGWLLVALAFGAVVWEWHGSQAGSEYFAGYLLERSLSLDNVFVFAVILATFAVPPRAQGKVLAWGIVLALGLRLVFILLGAALLDTFHATFYLFGALLVYSAWKLARHEGDQVHPQDNRALKLIRRRIPMTDDYHGEAIVVRQGGRRVATPLLAVFAVVATTDIVFAIDSIPAIFAITQDAFIVFAANAFAMLGLRALYFLLVGAMDRFAYLSAGLAVILAIIGAKMLLIDVWHPPIWLSLVLVVGVLVVTAVWSVVRPPMVQPATSGDTDDMGITDTVTGRVKQAAGALLGDDDLKRQGVDEERKGAAQDEARAADARAEAEVRRAEEAEQRAQERAEDAARAEYARAAGEADRHADRALEEAEKAERREAEAEALDRRT